MPASKRLPTVMGPSHSFSQVPRVNIERSVFDRSHGYKTTFDAGLLIPFLVDWILPGDTFTTKVTGFARIATLLKPLMDNMYWDFFFFFVPDRLVWTNFPKYMGEQTNPGDSISFTVPQILGPAAGYIVGRLGDYMGLPTLGVPAITANIAHSALPFRAFWLTYNQWFRDENLINSHVVPLGDGPDNDGTESNLVPPKRGKRHDYFTSALPFLQKGTAVALPLGTTAPVVQTTVDVGPTFQNTNAGVASSLGMLRHSDAVNPSPVQVENSLARAADTITWDNPGLSVNLSAATAATINDLRLAFQTQKFLERDARGGTRYTEIVRSHFGVVSPDARLQRAEYLGGGSVPVVVAPVAQTGAFAGEAVNKKLGDLGAVGSAIVNGVGFTKSFTEHGTLLGIMNARADLTYSQGFERQWSHQTRFDRYWPEFAHLGEQAILNKEIYATGAAADALVFGYQERYAEYRYKPSKVTGLFRPTATGTLEIWHLSEKFAVLPVLGQTFIEDQTTAVLATRIAVPAEPDFYCDMWIDMKCARPMPVFGVPGFMDHF